jgi:hypothetical protein
MSSEPPERGKTLVDCMRGALFGFTHNHSFGLDDGLIDYLLPGARARTANEFWYIFGQLGLKVRDCCAGVKSEMSFAAGHGCTVSCWDANPVARDWGNRLAELGLVPACDYTVTPPKCDVVFFDPSWDEEYDKATRTWDFGGSRKLLRMLSEAYASEAKLLVVKTPNYVKNLEIEPCATYQPGSGTGYMIFTLGKREPWVDIVLNSNLFRKKTEETPSRKPLNLTHNVSPSSVIEASVFDERMLKTSELSDMAFKLYQTGLEKATPLAELLSNLIRGKVDGWSIRSAFSKIETRIFSLFGDYMLWHTDEEFADLAKAHDFETTGEHVEVYVNAMKGKGFFHKGALIFADHTVNGLPVKIFGKWVKCAEQDKIFDRAFYGKKGFPLASAKGDVFVKGPDEVLKGRVLRNKPLQVLFQGEPRKGWSGLPMYDNLGKVVGVYSNHFARKNSHLTCQQSASWPELVVEEIQEGKWFTAWIPCGSGKSTWLPNVVAERVGRTITIQPRASLVEGISDKLQDCGFVSGDDPIPYDKTNLVMSHGKFLAAIEKNRNCFKNFDVILLDECHDQTHLTQLCGKWIEQVWIGEMKRKGCAMTGSPSSSSFATETLHHSKYPIRVEQMRYTKELTPQQVLAECSMRKNETIMVQVPSIRFAKEVIRLAKNSKRFEAVNAASLEIEPLPKLCSRLGKDSKRVLLCTNAINFGATLPVDIVMLQGTMMEKSVGADSVYSLQTRPLSVSEYIQWRGRVGRVRKGVCLVPRMNWTQPRMTSEENERLDAYSAVLGLSEADESIPRLQTALKLDAGLQHALGFVNDDGSLKVKVPDELLDKLRVPVREERMEKSIYKNRKRVCYGPITGFDSMAAKYLDLGGITKTGLIDWIAFPALIMLIISVLTHNVTVEAQVGRSNAEIVVPAPRDSHVPELQPGIELETESGLKSTIRTGLVEDFKDFSTWVSKLGSEFLEAVIDFVWRDGFATTVGNVKVLSHFHNRSRSLSCARYLSSVGKHGVYALGDYQGLSLNLDDSCFDGDSLSPEGQKRILKKPSSFSWWRTAFFSLLPPLTGLSFGVSWIGLVIGVVIARFGVSKDVISQWVRDMTSEMNPNWDLRTASKGWAFAKTSTFENLLAIITGPVSAIVRTVTWAIQKVDAALKGEWTLPFKVEYKGFSVPVRLNFMSKTSELSEASIWIVLGVSWFLCSLISPVLNTVSNVIANSMGLALGWVTAYGPPSTLWGSILLALDSLVSSAIFSLLGFPSMACYVISFVLYRVVRRMKVSLTPFATVVRLFCDFLNPPPPFQKSSPSTSELPDLTIPILPDSTSSIHGEEDLPEHISELGLDLEELSYTETPERTSLIAGARSSDLLETLIWSVLGISGSFISLISPVWKLVSDIILNSLGLTLGWAALHGLPSTLWGSVALGFIPLMGAVIFSFSGLPSLACFTLAFIVYKATKRVTDNWVALAAAAQLYDEFFNPPPLASQSSSSDPELSDASGPAFPETDSETEALERTSVFTESLAVLSSIVSLFLPGWTAWVPMSASLWAWLGLKTASVCVTMIFAGYLMYKSIQTTISRGSHLLDLVPRFVRLSNGIAEFADPKQKSWNDCYWAAISHQVHEEPEIVRQRVIAAVPKNLGLEKEDFIWGGSDVFAPVISRLYGRKVKLVWYDNGNLVEKEYGHDFIDGMTPITLFRTGSLKNRVTHWRTMYSFIKTGNFELIKASNVIPYIGYVLCCFGACVWFGAGMIPSFALALMPTVVTAMLVRKFNVGESYMTERAGAHALYDPRINSHPSDRAVKPKVPHFKAERVTVLSVAGDDVWFDRLYSSLRDRFAHFPQDGLLVYTTPDKVALVSDIVKRFPIEAKVVGYSMRSPAESRTVRYAPVFTTNGNPKTRYQIRDVDWSVVPIEQAMRNLEGNVTANPFLLCVSHVMGGLSDLNGQAGVEFEELFLSTVNDWDVYGHDEWLVTHLPLRVVISKMTPDEQAALWIGSIKLRMPRGSTLMISNKYIPFRGECPEGLEWKETNLGFWGGLDHLFKSHMLSSGYKTFCSWAAPHFMTIRTTRTSLLSLFGFGWISRFALVYSMMCNWFTNNVCLGIFEDTIEECYIAAVDGVSKTSVWIGSLVALPGCLKACEGCKSDAKVTYSADTLVEDDYRGWQNSRAARGQSGLFPFGGFQPGTMKMIQAAAWVVNPLGTAVSAILTSAFNLPNSHEISYYGAMAFSGSAILGLSALIGTFNSLVVRNSIVANACDIGASFGIEKTSVPFYSFDGNLTTLGVFDHEWLRKTPNIEDIGRLSDFDGWTFAWDPEDVLNFSLPDGMVNLRTSSAMALSASGLVKFSGQSTLVVGSGPGGFVQGMINEGFHGRLTVNTLPEPGFETSELTKHALANVEWTEVLAPVSTELGKFELVVCDVSKSALDPRWISDDFEHRDELFQEDLNAVNIAHKTVQKGGTFVCSYFLDDVLRHTELMDFLALNYKSVQVLVDPLCRTNAHLWYIASSKRGFKDARSILEFGKVCSSYDNLEHMSELLGIVKHRVCNEMTRRGYGAKWLSSLKRRFKLELPKFLRNDFVLDYNRWRTYADQELIDLVDSSPISLEPFEFEPIKSLAPSQDVEHSGKAFDVRGRASEPVQDRIHNTGFDMIHFNLLSEAGLITEVDIMEVPGQSNQDVRAGLTLRYDFPSVDVDKELFEPAFDFMKRFCGEKAKDFDFTPPTWDEILEDKTLNKASSMGFMSTWGFKNVGDALRNGKEVLDLVYDKLITGKSLNHIWHASPKVEKKEATGKKLIPRLFQYKEGTVRLCEMRLFQRVNDFFGKLGGLPWSMKGDMFSKAEKIVTDFERFSNPAAVEVEASKWDGHFEDWLFAKVRDLESHVVSCGKNGSDAANVLKATAGVDAYGTTWMCSGDVVEFKRSNRKSGSWETSIGNKNGNVPIALTLVKEAGKFSSFEEVLENAAFSCEGDDLLIVGEKPLMEKVLQLRNSTYEKAGFTMRCDFKLLTCPEETRFCSHGATRVAEDICVPIRSLREVFGRLMIPLTNNTFSLDYNMASRSLSSAISLVATFWYLPEVRHYWNVVRDMIPKSVIAKGVDKKEKWKFVSQLGLLDPTSFDLREFIETRFGRFPKVVLNKSAIKELDLSEFVSLGDVEASGPVQNLLKNGPNPFKNKEVVFWYSSSVSANEALADFSVVSANLNASLIVETSEQLRQIMRLSGGEISCGWRSLRAAIGSTSGALVAVFHGSEIERANATILMYDKARLKQDGFRGASFTVYCQGDVENSSFVKTSAMVWSLTFAVTCILLLMSSILLPEEKPGKTAMVRPGLNVEASTGPVLVKNSSVLTMCVSQMDRVGSVVPRGFQARTLYSRYIDARKQVVHLSKKALQGGLVYMASNHRRFGVLKYDKMGNLSTALVYYRNYMDRDLENEAWTEIDDIEDLLGQKPLPKKNWTYNGGMLTMTPWSGTISLGQFERPQKLFFELEGSLKSCVLFLRIDDCPMVRADDEHPNPYVHPGKKVTPVTTCVPVFGENTSPNYLDFPKPFDAEIVGSGVTSYSNWAEKKVGAVFRGGVTGMGCNSSDNTRLWLKENFGNHDMCDIGFVSTIDRVCVTLNQNVGVKPPIERAEKMSYFDMGMYKAIFVVEGNECADRLALCMETGSVVIYVRPQHCVGVDAWWASAIEDKYNLLLVDATVEAIEEALLFVKNNDAECQMIAERGRNLALKLLSTDFQKQYILGLLSDLNERNTLSRVEDIIKVRTTTHSKHALVVRDADFNYVHGTALSLTSASTTYRKCDVDYGCGITLFEYSGARSMNLGHEARKLRPGTEKLTENEVLEGSMLCRLAGFEGSDAQALMCRLGTVGGGNHFIETVSNGPEILLLVHTGSRGFMHLWMERNVVDMEGPVGQKFIKAAKLAQQFATLNRNVCARLLGASAVREEIMHDRLHDEGAIPYLDGTTLVVGLLVNPKNAWVMGGPGTGVALLESSGALVPHGTGGKGGRTRNLRDVERKRWYKTCARIGNDYQDGISLVTESMVNPGSTCNAERTLV